MAYVIGSQKGKDIAKNMTVGSTYKASDGSTWTKQSDGSVSVTTSAGETFNNAYSPTSSGGSSGKTYTTANGKTAISNTGSSGGSSGGSSKNSQYSAPTLGDTWNANTDYQAIINNAVANGDYVTAAKAEQLRNQKITATGSNYNTTNMYTGYLDNTDYGTMGQQLMANNASWQDVLDVYNSRYNKAVSTEGLQKYANDEVQQMMWQYIQDNMQQSSQQDAQDQFNQWMQEYEQNNPKQEYESKYDPQIDALLNEILNREDFSYDALNDPLYQQYAAMYQREGDRAMKETMAEAAAGAGGMNTYAITAAMQANNYYNSQLNDKIPQLYQIAYEMYLNDKESKVQDLGILQNMDATQYSRYRDTISDYYNDKNFAYGAYQDAIQQGNWQTNYNYNSALDNRNFNYNDYWKNKEWDYNDMWTNKEWDTNQSWKEKEWDASQEEKEYNRTESARKDAENKMMTFVDLGKMPSDDIITQAGWNKADVEVLVAAVQAQLAKTGGSGGGSSSRKKSGGDPDETGFTGDGKEEENDSPTGNGTFNTSWSDLMTTPDYLPITQTAGNFATVYNDCQTLNKTEAKNYLNKVKTTGAIDNVQYNWLMNKFGK